MVTKLLNYKNIFYLTIILFLFTFKYPAISKESKTILHFVHITDTHVHFKYIQNNAKLYGSSQKLLSNLVKQINKMDDLDFVLATGDLVDQSREELFDKFIEITMSLNSPLYVTLGNHDVGVNTRPRKKGIIKKFYASSNKTNFPHLLPYYSFTPNEDTAVICLDTTTEKVVTALGLINDEQLNWLKEELEKYKDKIILIAIHTSPVEPIKIRSHFFLRPDKKELFDIINNYKNVVAIFAGDYELSKIKKYKKKYYITSPSIVKYPFAYREIIVTRKSNKRRNKYYMELKWHTIYAPELEKIGKENLNGWENLIGKKRDRERKIKLFTINN